ncbi:hypothetical protein Y032_0084g1751 [Ancylostoma ceylanicum]|uniref:ShKT domain-containing protein n=1 Tax=Ancylostoma ceylanicum TaxID=53326 RepID=A0A016TR16_9BILA|nr:hypothetical protein Y032_0084g1751 [Ancylostoma ceylanicum]
MVNVYERGLTSDEALLGMRGETTTARIFTTQQPTPPPFTQGGGASTTRMKHIIPVADGFQAKPTVITVSQPGPPSQIPGNAQIARRTGGLRKRPTPHAKKTKLKGSDTQQTPVTQAPFIISSTSVRPFSQQQQVTQQVFQPSTQQITFFRPEPSQTTFRQTNTFTAAIQTRPSAVPSQFRPNIPDLRRPTAIIRFCFDRDGVERCADWVPYCRSERFYAYMRTYCARSCGFC